MQFDGSERERLRTENAYRAERPWWFLRPLGHRGLTRTRPLWFRVVRLSSACRSTGTKFSTLIAFAHIASADG